MELGKETGAAMEHRWGQRHAVDRMVSLHAGGWHVPARLMNISSSGAYLLCAVPDASVVRIRLQFRRELRSTRLVAYVVRRSGDGIGVEWDKFAPQAVTRLLSREYPDPAQVSAPPRVARATAAGTLSGVALTADSYIMRRGSQAGAAATLE